MSADILSLRTETPSQRALRLAATPVRTFGRLSSRSRAMHETFAQLGRFAARDLPVLLLGETGVGKEVLARTIHEQSPRARRPFVVFDCSSVAPHLAESELLGHERGAFTGAACKHPGAFERAQSGTLFLDEIGELPLELQPRLLRALERGEIRRVGGEQEHRMDVRIIAATHRDLQADVKAGRFRQDLFFRLAVAVVHVPTLGERPDDLPDLVQSLLRELGRADLVVTAGAFDALRRHAWPGNVRELKNVIACGVALLDPGAHALEAGLVRQLLQERLDEDGPPVATREVS